MSDWSEIMKPQQTPTQNGYGTVNSELSGRHPAECWSAGTRREELLQHELSHQVACCTVRRESLSGVETPAAELPESHSHSPASRSHLSPHQYEKGR